jgi:hypothetical protein
MKLLKRLPPILFSAVLALVGALSVFTIFASSIIVRIAYFDYDGGEPGSETIYGSIILWPVVLIAMVAVAIGSAKRPWIAGIAGGVACIFVMGAWVMLRFSPARNRETRTGQNTSAMASPIPLRVD